MAASHSIDLMGVAWRLGATLLLVVLNGFFVATEFALVTARRRFVVPATIASLGWFLVFVLLCGLAQDFMATSIYEGLTVAYVLGISQILMVWVVSWRYLRYSDRTLDPLARQALQAQAEPVAAEVVHA